MCKYFVQTIEMDRPNKIGKPIYGFLVFEIEEKEYDDVSRESSLLLSFEFLNYTDLTLEQARNELFQAILKHDSNLLGCQIAYCDLDMEVSKRTFQAMMYQARHQYEYEE
jgi:hypothetical protein